MLIAFDAHYHPDRSQLAAATFKQWAAPEPLNTYVWHSGPAADYEPGKFYLRELPLLLNALQDFELATIDTIIIDGYVCLNDQGRLGLGGHLYHELDKKIPVVGVAKSYFRDTNAEAVLRGTSKKPLYITALGMEATTAARHVREMAGEYRMPDLLGIVDRGSKEEYRK